MAGNRRVRQVDASGEVVATYDSVCMASRETGISRSYISMALNGIPSRIKGVEYPKTQAGGYTWEPDDAE